MRPQFRLTSFAVLCLALTGFAADGPNFSGSYKLTGSKGSFKIEKGKVWTVSVVQTDTAIEVTRVMDGRSNVNKYPLDGQEGAYISPGGFKGVCKGQFKGKYLILESVVTTHPQANGPPVQLHTKERWELSRDLKTLVIHTDVDSPIVSFQLFEPWSEIYTRE